MRASSRYLSSRAAAFVAALLSAAAAIAQDGDEPVPTAGRPAAAAPQLVAADFESRELVLEFDQPMSTWSTPSASPLLTLTPAVACKWYWRDDTRLACVPPVQEGKYEDADAFGLAMPFRLTIAAGLTGQNGVALAPTVRDLVANPPDPRVSARGWDDGRPQLVLTSNQPLAESSLRKLLQVTFADAPVALRLDAVDAETLRSLYGSAMAWHLRLDSLPAAPGRLAVTLTPGLRSLAGPARGTGGKLWDQAINAPFALTDAMCDRQYGSYTSWHPGRTLECPAESDVLLYFSRPLDPATVAGWAAALPDGLALAEKPTDCGYRCDGASPRRQGTLRLTPQAAGRTFRIDTGPPLRSNTGNVLAPASVVDLKVHDHLADLRSVPPVQVLLPGAGSANAAVVEGRNLPALQWAQVAIGSRRSTLTLANVAASAPRNQYTPLALPPLDAQVRARGGLVVSGIATMPAVENLAPANGAHATAVAAFNLIALPESGRLLLWASDWAGADGLAGVDVDLVALKSDGSEAVLGSARTGADGSVWLNHGPLPEADGADPQTRDTYLLLRARHRGRSTVLPLESTGSNRGSGIGGVRLTQSWSQGPEKAQWGATSRLLYRPGDTVDWRLWLRERQGNALQRPAAAAVTLELRLAGYNGRLHEQWGATLDDWGSVDGHLRLPETLDDGTYCIAAKETVPSWATPMAGACFQVARFDAPSLWATLATEDRVYLRGDALTLAGSGGFFSGGSAANAGAHLSGLAQPVSFTDAWPELARWEFFGDDSSYGVSADPLAGQVLPTKLDGEGALEFTMRLPARLGGRDADGAATALAFARLQFNLAVDDGGKARAVSPPAAMYYAAHERYVGLRTSRGWLTLDSDPVVEAVVATHAGRLLPGVDVELRIESNDGETPRVLARCTLSAGVEEPCKFRAPEAGMYALVAESGDAAPVRIQRWFGDYAQPVATADVDPVTLEVITASVAGAPARLRLRQPHEHASALVLVEHEGVLTYWLQDVGADSEIVVPVQADWHPGVSVRVLLRPRVADAAAGLATKTRMLMVRLDLPRAANEVVDLALAANQLAPGDEAVLILHNPHAEARRVTLAIVDDAVHQQASVVRPLLDPAGRHVLGQLGEWRVSDWLALENWTSLRNPLFRHLTASPIVVEMSAPVALAPPAPPAPPPPAENDRAQLDRIEVTGSRIKHADVEAALPVVVIDGNDVAAGDPLTRLPSGMSGPAAERVRSQFPETAYWNTGVELAPGETREVRVRLPDNLTRWRVLAWSSDRGGDLELHEVTLQTSLVVELRTGLPAMLYPGDTGDGIVSARLNAADGTHLELRATATGAGVDATTAGEGTVAAHDLLQRPLALAPTAEGRIDVLAHASDGGHSDTLSASVPVRSRHARLAIAQTGWLDRGEIVLGRPALPDGASDTTLELVVAPGLQAWRREWIAGLRNYPHRCWEQILSRGIGAAFALQDVQSAADWPEAQQTIDDAWRVAAQYRDPNGRYDYFTGVTTRGYGGYGSFGSRFALSAYTLRGVAAMDALGQPAPAHLRAELQTMLRTQLQQVDMVSIAEDSWALDTLAATAGALADARVLPDADADASDASDASDDAATADAAITARLRGLWQHWDDLSWYGRSELVRALAAMPALQAEAQQGLVRLRGAGVRRGASRRLDDPRDFTALMGSSLRDQCALVTTLATLDTTAEGIVARNEFLRGLQDLYAGGNESLDSQANAQCLLALRAAGVDLAGTQASVVAELRIDGAATALVTNDASADSFRSDGGGDGSDGPGDRDEHADGRRADHLPPFRRPAPLPPQVADGSVRWSGPLPDGDLVLAATPSPDLSYLAEVRYRVDLRNVEASGTGMQLERQYLVMRDGDWTPVTADGVRIGDWIRVTLQVTVPRQRHFVAITDVVPGGWASRDVSLAGVAGEDVRRIADNGSWYFATRRTGAGEVKLYAESLPAGVHQVHWYAQATHAGDYFAAPAIAELMYGRATRATTAPATVVVGMRE
jgi:hypothetical protein